MQQSNFVLKWIDNKKKQINLRTSFAIYLTCMTFGKPFEHRTGCPSLII